MKKIIIIVYLLAAPVFTVHSSAIACSLAVALEYQYGPYTEDTNIRTRGDELLYFKQGVNTWPGASEIATAKEDCRIAVIVKGNKKTEIIKHGLSLIQAHLPGIKDWQTLELIKELWLSIAPAAQQATINFQAAIDIYQYGLDKIIWLATASEQDIDAYDPTTDLSWP